MILKATILRLICVFSIGQTFTAQAANDFQVSKMARHAHSAKDSPAPAALDAKLLPLRTQRKMLHRLMAK